MNKRSNLHEVLVGILGSRNVYFQPPETIKMVYPCIVYQKTNIASSFADNIRYKAVKRYSVTVIDSDPDSGIPDKLLELPLCSFDRHFTQNNLNHDVYSLYF